MIEVKAEGLREQGFTPYFQKGWNPLPEYAERKLNGATILIRFLRDNSYFVHRASDSQGRGYTELQVEELGRKTQREQNPVRDLDSLQAFLENPLQGITNKIEEMAVI